MKTQSGGDTPLYEAVLSSLEDVLKPVKRRKALILFTDGVDTASREIGEMATLNAAREDNATIYSIYFNTFRNVPYQPAQAHQPSPGGRSSSGIPAPGMPPETVTMPPISGTVVPRGASVVDHVLGRDYLRRLSDSSGGMVVDALKLQDVGPAFEQIAKELASQYSIGYYPTNTAHDGKFRKVQVKLNKPGLAVRTRKGYTAPKPPDGKKKK
jgi:VWFA-related protein